MARKEPDFVAVQDIDVANAAFVAAWRDRNWSEVLDELHAARADWVAWLESLPPEEFFRPRSYGGYDWSFYTTPLPIQWQHDAEHADQIAAWRSGEGLWPKGWLPLVRTSPDGDQASPRTIVRSHATG